MRSLHLFGAVVGATALAFALVPSQVQAGQQAGTASSSIPKFSELPTGRMTSRPSEKDKVASIPSGETVPGLRVTLSMNTGAQQQLTVVAADMPVRDPAVGASAMPATIEGVAGCFSQVQATMLGQTSLALQQQAAFGGVPNDIALIRAAEWDNGLTWQASIWAQPTHSVQTVAIHHERVVESGSTTTLDSVDSWFDPATRGFRLISKASLPLKQVGSAPGGVRIFAGRDERPDGKRFVQFVVTRAKDTPFQQIQSVHATRSDGTMVQAGACAHHRVALLATPDKKTGVPGETSVLHFTTILPDLPPGEHSAAMPLPTPFPASPPGQTTTRDIRTRLVRAHFSLSQTSRDKEPVIAVSTSWAGPETMQRISNPNPMFPKMGSPPPQPTPAPFPPPPPPPSKSVKPTAGKPPVIRSSSSRFDSGF